MKDKTRRSSKKNSKKENKKYPYRKTRKRKENKKRDLAIYFLLGLIIGMLFVVYVQFSFDLIISLTPLIDQIQVFSFATVSDFWEDSGVVNDLAYLCSLREEPREQVYCAYDFVASNTYFENHHNHSNILRKPEEIFSKSIVCRDVATLLKSVYTKMGFENEFVTGYRHIYNKVYVNDEVCYVDAANFDFYCGGEE